LIISGRAKPSFVVSHEINIDAPGAYEKFDKRIDGYTKVLIHPMDHCNMKGWIFLDDTFFCFSDFQIV